MTNKQALSVKANQKVYLKDTGECMRVKRREIKNENEDTYYFILYRKEEPDKLMRMGHKWLSLEPINIKKQKRKY